MPNLLRLSVLFAFIIPASLSVQPSVAGRWVAEFELGVRNDNGVITSTGNGKARIALTTKGDSVFGTWTFLEPAESAAQPARALKGTYTKGTLLLDTEPRSQRIRINEQESMLRTITRYELELVAGDTLAGTQRIVAIGDQSLDASLVPPPRPFRATRDRG